MALSKATVTRLICDTMEGGLFITKYVSEQLFEKLKEGKSYNVMVKGGYVLRIMRCS